MESKEAKIKASDVLRLHQRVEGAKKLASYAVCAAREDFEKILRAYQKANSYEASDFANTAVIYAGVLRYNDTLVFEISCSQEAYFYHRYYKALIQCYDSMGWNIPENVKNDRFNELMLQIDLKLKDFKVKLDKKYEAANLNFDECGIYVSVLNGVCEVLVTEGDNGFTFRYDFFQESSITSGETILVDMRLREEMKSYVIPFKGKLTIN